MRCSWTDGHVSTYHLSLSFVSIVNNVTQHWCTWDHAVYMCMYMSSPRTDWHVPMCAMVLSRVICIICMLLIFILPYCSACVSIHVFHSHLYILLPFNYIYTFHHHCHVNTCNHTLFIQSECFVQPFTDEDGCIVTEMSGLL